LEASFVRVFLSGSKQLDSDCKQMIFTTNFPWITVPKSAQISKDFRKFCANFKGQKQAFLKSIFKALPMSFLKRR
jgi:hypothetical protein